MAVQLVSNGRNSYYNSENYRPQTRIVRTPTIRDDEDDDNSYDEIAKRRAEVAHVAPRRSKGSVPKAGKAYRAPGEGGNSPVLRAAKSSKPAHHAALAVPPNWVEVALPKKTKKKACSIRLDEDLIEFCKELAGARGYQTVLNNIVRGFKDFYRATEGEAVAA